MTSKKRALALVAVVAVMAVAVPMAVFEAVVQRPLAAQQATQGPTQQPTPAPTLPPVPAGLTIHVNPISGLGPDSIMGADVSMLAQMEANGAKFFVNGAPEDCLQILRDHGVNWIRLRIWNDPTDANGISLGAATTT